MQILFNDQPMQCAAGQTVHELLEQLDQRQAGAALAINQQIVPREQWAQHIVQDGDQILLFQVTTWCQVPAAKGWLHESQAQADGLRLRMLQPGQRELELPGAAGLRGGGQLLPMSPYHFWRTVIASKRAIAPSILALADNLTGLTFCVSVSALSATFNRCAFSSSLSPVQIVPSFIIPSNSRITGVRLWP